MSQLRIVSENYLSRLMGAHRYHGSQHSTACAGQDLLRGVRLWILEGVNNW